MSDLSPLSGEERKSNFGAVRSVDDTSAPLLTTALVEHEHPRHKKRCGVACPHQVGERPSPASAL
jgi:hypothetical protein